MAVRFLIEVGALSSEKTLGSQAKAAATLLAFYKLDAVLAHLTRYIVGAVRQRHVSGQEAVLQVEAETTYGVD